MQIQTLSTFALLLSLATSQAQEPKSVPAPPPATAASPLNELEAKFQAALKNVTFQGVTQNIENHETITEGRSDSYKIVGADKLGEGKWTIRAKFAYGDKEFEVPIPVKVTWAGDTPVIIVDKLALPGSKVSYTARVLVFDGTYAGSWSGGDKAGLLSGIIKPAAK
jgi:hypothetical protein